MFELNDIFYDLYFDIPNNAIICIKLYYEFN